MKLFTFTQNNKIIGSELAESALEGYQLAIEDNRVKEIPADVVVSEPKLTVSLNVKEAKRLLALLSVNDTRYYCNMACVLPGGFIQASDAQTLIKMQVHMDGVIPDFNRCRSLCIKTETIKELVAVARAKKQLSIEITESQMILMVYPIADSAFPTRTQELCWVRVDDLANIAKALPEGATVKIEYEPFGEGGTKRPLKLSDGDGSVGLIVPVYK